MGNCCKSCKFYRKQHKNITLLLTGLDDAGKTTVAKILAGEPTDSVLKTLGFSLVVLRYHGYKISLYDLGGSSQIRDIWNKYFMDAHGIIYVVDASNMPRLEESKLVFASLLSHTNISGKPILLLANKQDKEQALDELEIVEHLNVEYMVNKYRCPTKVEICTAFAEPSKIDRGIKNGFRWLVDIVIQNYKVLSERVDRDMEEYAVLVQKNKEEWKKRTRSRDDECRDEMSVQNGNPFQPIESYIKYSSNDVPTIRNGVAKTVLVDNVVKSKISTNQMNKIRDRPLKTDKSTRASRVVVITNAIDKKNKLGHRYHRFKKKFRRFNKIAPQPIDLIMRGKSSHNEEQRKTSNYSVKSCITYDVERKNNTCSTSFLSRRPATAPPKMSFSMLKVETAWNLAVPLEVTTSTSRNSVPTFDISDSEDVVSYF